MRIVLAVLCVVAFAGAARAQEWTRPQPVLPRSPLVIETAKGPARFTVELAATPETRERGLMFRRRLGAHTGMLFDFQDVRAVSFWMKNTLIPLDMIFIRADGHIARIAANATPLSTGTIPSGVPVEAVLEIAGGRAGELGIRPGDLVRHRIFGNWRAP
jgi:uncharacterized protein